MNIRNQPATTDGVISGNITSFSLRSHPAPDTCAASSSEGLTCESAETTVLIPISIYFIIYAIIIIHIVL